MKRILSYKSDIFRPKRVKILLVLICALFSLWLLNATITNEKDSSSIIENNNNLCDDPDIVITPKSAAGPTGSISINNGSTTLSFSQTVPLDLSFNDTGGSGGLYGVRFSNDGIGWSTWETPLFEKNWVLSAGYGYKTVYYEIRDNAAVVTQYNTNVAYGFVSNCSVQSRGYKLSQIVPGIQGDGLSWNTAYRFENWSSIDLHQSSIGVNFEDINEYVIIRNCTIYGGSDIGIRVVNCTHIKFISNNITSVPNGFVLITSPYAEVLNNSLSNVSSWMGIVSSSNNVTFQWNTFIGNGGGGIMINSGQSGIVIQYNNFTTYWYGITIEGTFHIIRYNLLKSCYTAVLSTNSPTSDIGFNIMNANTINLDYTGSSPGYHDNYATIQAPNIYSYSNYLLQWTCQPFASYYYILNYSTPITEINSSLTVVGIAWGKQFNVTDQEKVSYYVVLSHQDFLGNSSQSNCILISTAPMGTIAIDTGATYTNDPDVTLGLTYSDIGSGVDQVRYSNDSLTWTDWEAPLASRAWTLLLGDGIKTVYYEIRDLAGLITHLSDTIVLDMWAPSGSIAINTGDPWTNKTSVTLSLTYSDGGMGVDQVHYSNDSVTWTSWESPSASKTLWLTSIDGSRTVWYEIRDLCGNITRLSDTIGLDTTAPAGSISINSGAAWTNITAVSLTLTSSDTGSGVDMIHFSNDSVTWTNWQAPTSPIPVWLTSGDGSSKTVWYEIRDVAGVILRISDTIGLDTTAPTGSIVINSGVSWTNVTNVSLSLTYNDGLSGVDQIRFSNDSLVWTDWESPTLSKAVWLTLGDSSSKIIWYEIRDVSGVILRISDTIGLDTTAPTGSITINSGASWTGLVSITLTLTYGDAGIGVDQVRYSNDTLTWTNWEAASVSKNLFLPTGDGSKTIYYEIRDLLGWYTTLSDSIELDQTAPSGSIIINLGDTYTGSATVSLTLTFSDVGGSGVDQVQYGHPGDPDWWTNWEAPSASRSYDVPIGDGTKTVWYRIRDNVGLITQYSDTIVLDTLVPSGSITINNGAAWSNATNVSLSLTYSDGGSGIDQVRYSNDTIDWTDWESAQATRLWNLTLGDESKTVYYEVRDFVGYITRVSDTIGLDTNAPTGSIIINSGALWTNVTNVSLSLTYNDGTGSGIDRVRYSNDTVTWTNWDFAYNSRIIFLSPGDETKTIYYEIRDVIGFITRVSDTIGLDTTAPMGSIIINSGSLWTNATNVSLSLTYSDGGSNIDQVRYSNDTLSWTDWESAQATRSWNISSGDGSKIIYYEIRDLAGVILRVSDTIGLDTTLPTGTIIINGGANYVNITAVSLTLSYSDAGSGIYQVRFSNDSATWTDWETPSVSRAWTLPTGEGLKTVYFQVSDNAGWVGADSDDITLDTIAPSGTILLYNGSAYTNTTNIYLNLTTINGGPGNLLVRFSNNSITWSTWETPTDVRNWILVTGDGPRTVYYEITDEANNTFLTSDTIDQDVTPPTGSIVINDGDIATNDVNVHLDLTAADTYSLVDQVRFSNDSIIWSDWEAPLAIKSWTIASGEGIKTVFYQIRDHYGVIAMYNDTIAIDNTDPTGNITINADAEWTGSPQLTLTLTFDDIGAGVDMIRFSNDSITWSDWQLPVFTQQWTVSDVSGNKTVFYQVRDRVSRSSVIYNDTIKLDNVLPVGSIIINNNAVYTSNLTLSLNLTSSDLGAGVNQIRFRAGIGTWSGWETPTTFRLWTLTMGDGQRTISYQISDNAGNIAEFSDTIIIDTKKPFGTIEINQGAKSTTNTTVTLTLIYEDESSGVYQVRYSNDGMEWSAWESPTPTKSWILNSTLGVKSVYYQILDNAGIIAEYSSTITLVEPSAEPPTTMSDDLYTMDTEDIIVLASVLVIMGSVIGLIVMKAKKKSGKGSRNDKYRATAGQKSAKPKKVKAKPKTKLSKAKAQPPKTTGTDVKSDVKLKPIEQKGEIEKSSEVGIVDVSLQFQKQPKKKK